MGEQEKRNGAPTWADRLACRSFCVGRIIETDFMKNIKRLISIVLILISVWIIRYVPFYIMAEYPVPASFLLSAIIMLSFALALSTFTSKNRALDNLRVVTIVLAVIGIFPGAIFSHKYIIRAKYAFLQREGIMGRAVVTDKKIGKREGKNKGVMFTDYELFFSFLTNEKRISKSMQKVSEKIYETVHVRDSFNVVYLQGRTDVFDLIISKSDSAFYAAKLKPIR